MLRQWGSRLALVKRAFRVGTATSVAKMPCSMKHGRYSYRNIAIVIDFPGSAYIRNTRGRFVLRTDGPLYKGKTSRSEFWRRLEMYEEHASDILDGARLEDRVRAIRYFASVMAGTTCKEAAKCAWSDVPLRDAAVRFARDLWSVLWEPRFP